MGSTVQSKIHVDGVILEVTLQMDGEMCVHDEKFLVPVEESLPERFARAVPSVR